MKKKSIIEILVGEWNTKTVVGIAIGAALFGVLMIYGSIPVFGNTKLTTSMLVQVVVGALFGPLPAFVSAFLGNVIADTLGGWGYWFDWSIGNGVLAFLIGLLPLYGANINEGVFKVKHAVIFALIAIFGNAIAFGVVTPILTSFLYGGELSITFIQAIIGSVSNIVVFIVLGIPLLFALAKRNASSQNLSKE